MSRDKYIGMDVNKEAIVIVLNGSGKLVMETILETYTAQRSGGGATIQLRRIIKGRPFEVSFECEAKLYRKEHPYGH
jgi:hypothetical protein